MSNVNETTSAEKATSKMSLATAIFKSVQAQEKPRASFIKQAQLSPEQGGAGLTKKGAGTYYQMLHTEAKGGKKYGHTKRKAENDAKTAPIAAQ